MFRCPLCSRVAPPRTPPQHLVLVQRPRQYALRPRANRLRRPPRNGKKRKSETVYTCDPGGRGTETVRELLVCADCARRNGAP